MTTETYIFAGFLVVLIASSAAVIYMLYKEHEDQ